MQWEACSGTRLRLRGAEVEYLTCGGNLEICDRGEHVGGAADAVPELPALCAHQPRRARPRERADVGEPPDTAWPEIDAIGLADLPDVEIDGLPLGRLVEIPVKWFLMRSDIEDDPVAALTYRRFLRSARGSRRRLRRGLERHQPDVVIACNGLFLFESIAVELCKQRGIDFVTYERGLIKETLVFRRGEPACLLDASDVWDRWRDVALSPRSRRARRVSRRPSPRAQDHRPVLEGPRFEASTATAAAASRPSSRISPGTPR